MRALFVIAEVRPKLAGAEVRAERLALALAEQHADVEIITRRAEGTPACATVGPVKAMRLRFPHRRRIKLLVLTPLVFKGYFEPSS